MNATRNLKINFFINQYERNGVGAARKVASNIDHVINNPKDRHVQPHQPKRAATKPYKLYHNHKTEEK